MNKTLDKIGWTFLAGLILTLAATGCDFRKLPLPSENVPITAFGANDTSYIEVNPVWNSTTLGVELNQPTDIIVGPDGYLWVTNAGNNEVIALKKSGEVILEHGFDGLKEIPSPTALTIDSKLNVVVANNTNRLFIWNEYLHIAEVQEVAFRGVFRRSSGDTVQYPIDRTEAFLSQQVDSLHFEGYLFLKTPEAIASVLSPGEYYRAPDSKLRYYGVASGVFGSDEIYASENFRSRIARFKLVPWARVRLANQREIFAYRGKFDRNVVTYGSGAGTVDNPRGIYVDKYGNLYLTQLGGNFLVQKLQPGTFFSAFELHKHPIMDLNRFSQPMDITTDDQNDIFVVDRGLHRVFKFRNSNPGAGREIDLGNKGLGVAEFEDPRGILVVDNVVYVVDTGRNEIRRFKISVSESDVPVEPGGEQP